MNYSFKINDFEGPLDLLLHLLKENKMDITQINVSVIVSQYLDFLHQMESLNIDVASEYLVMASELVHLKSKLLLQEDDEDDEEFELNSEEDLKNRLIDYQKYKNLTEDFRLLESKRNEIWTKLPTNLNEYKDDTIVIKNELKIDDLLNAFLKYLDRQALDKPLKTKITKREYSIEERTTSIRETLRKKKKLYFVELFDIMNKDYIIVTFLSILEMTKNQEVFITQNDNFSDILIEMSDQYEFA